MTDGQPAVQPGAQPERARRRLVEPEQAAATPPERGGFLGLPPAEMSKPSPAELSKPSPAPSPVAALNPDASAKLADAVGLADAVATPADGVEKPKGKRKLPEPALWAIEITAWVAGALVLSTLLRLFVFQLFVVPSMSMENTLQINDRIAALKYTHFKRGDMVVFVNPQPSWLTEPAKPVSAIHRFFEHIGLLASTDEQYLVKRAIGLPGDRVQCCTVDGRLLINGVAIDERTYLAEPTEPASGFEFDVTVPAGRVFVLGDNRYHSADSRYHLCQADSAGFGMNGFVPVGNIVGPVRAVVLPFSHISHKPTPTAVFASVPGGLSPPPAVATVSVTNGPAGSCRS